MRPKNFKLRSMYLTYINVYLLVVNFHQPLAMDYLSLLSHDASECSSCNTSAMNGGILNPFSSQIYILWYNMQSLPQSLKLLCLLFIWKCDERSTPRIIQCIEFYYFTLFYRCSAAVGIYIASIASLSKVLKWKSAKIRIA